MLLERTNSRYGCQLMTYWCSDHQQWERDTPHTPDSTYNEVRAENARQSEEIERLWAILGVVASCSENDDVALGQHLCVEQVRIEVARHKGQVSESGRS